MSEDKKCPVDREKNTCGECFHFDACRKMMEASLDPSWDIETIPLEGGRACEDFIESSLVMSALQAEERLKRSKPAKSQKNPPVDRGKLLIAMEQCIRGQIVGICSTCPFVNTNDCAEAISKIALPYIYYLEEQLGVTG